MLCVSQCNELNKTILLLALVVDNIVEFLMFVAVLNVVLTDQLD